MNNAENPEVLKTLPVIIFALLVLAFTYLIPTIVAVINKKKRWWLTFLLNVLFGWTGIGWMILLVLALSKDEEKPKKENRKKSH